MLLSAEQNCFRTGRSVIYCVVIIQTTAKRINLETYLWFIDYEKQLMN